MQVNSWVRFDGWKRMCSLPEQCHSRMTAWLSFPCRSEGQWKLIAPGAFFRLPTAIPVTTAVEWQLALHGTVAQDRLSDPPGHGDASLCRVGDGEPFVLYTPARRRLT